jgi:parvulin-like peptidyl-prolyl isomerase
MEKALTEAQEAEAQELAQAIAQAASDEFLRLARTLVAAGGSPFGKTEFAIRDILLRVGAKAYEQHLAQKKTATKAPA